MTALAVDANVWVAALDPQDRFHATSARFLLRAAEMEVPLHAPAFALVEISCAVVRRAGDAAIGPAVIERLRGHPLLALHSMDDAFLALAADVGTSAMLRGADALYAATALAVGGQVVTWDRELVTRALGVTPAEWLRA